MTFTVEKKTKTSLDIAVLVPAEEMAPFLPKAAEAISAEHEIEGFRTGKAPYAVVKQKFGEFRILEEASRRYIEEHFEDVLDRVKTKEFAGVPFEPIGQPAIAITKLAPNEPLGYRMSITLLPPITLPDYRAIAKKVLAATQPAAVSEDEVASAITWLRESRATLITVQRPAQSGDRVEVDFSGTAGGVAIEGLSSSHHPLVIGENRFLPGFEDHLTGMAAGAEKTFTVSIPKDYRAEVVRGKDIVFRVLMHLVQERKIPLWDDAFAKTIGNFSTVADVEKDIRDGMLLEKEREGRERARIAITEAIAEKTPLELPAPLIEHELEKMRSELASSVERAGLKFQDYLAHIKQTEDDLRRQWRGDAERRVQIALILREIGRAEKIEPTETDIREAIARTMAHRGMSENDLKAVDQASLVDYHRGIARNERVFQILEGRVEKPV